MFVQNTDFRKIYKHFCCFRLDQTMRTMVQDYLSEISEAIINYPVLPFISGKHEYK